ncbi:MAG TPA: family 20 glycosylhydrolase, partial [Arachidicoccus sp.]|nr:family 20 glycosylhydrolase [Arachidicoccus sp.]
MFKPLFCLIAGICFFLTMPEFGLAQSPEQKVDTAALLAGVGDLPHLQPKATLLGLKGAQLQRIKLPAAPQGFRLELLGTDHLPVINVKGEIHPPISDTKVVLYLQLVQLNNPTFRLDISRSVMVPGLYSKEATADRVPVPAPFVIPALKEWQGQQGIFSLDPNARIVIDPTQKESLAALSEQLHQEIKVQNDLDLPVRIGKPGKGDILIRLSQSDTALGLEGYRLHIGENIELSAPHEPGLFWGTRTLLQLLEDTLKLPYGMARDYPSFAVRGLVLDVGRKFFTLDFLKDYVKLLSYYKLNDFQIHLSDNGFKKYFGDNWDSTYSAFRLENSTYPGLTAKDGHYTKQEFRDLQQLGRQYGVNIVPEIDVPAHALAFSKVIPEIGSKKYGLDHLDLHNPKTDTVVQNVFREYLAGPNPVFSGQVVDIGTDEYAKADGEAFRGFTDRMIRFVQGYGKQVRLWGALTWAKGNTPVQVKGVTMNTWYNGYAEPTAMKKLGYNQISTPDGWLYIVPAAGYYYD